MGCYDTILISCPNCGEEEGAQSKSGECRMQTMSLQEAVDSDDDCIWDVNRHAPHKCFGCGCTFEVSLEVDESTGRVVSASTEPCEDRPLTDYIFGGTYERS